MCKREREPPVDPLNPNTTQLHGLDDAYESFYWLGYFAGRQSSDPGSPSKGEKKEPTPGPDQEPEKRPERPLCEIAEFLVFDTETSGLSASDCAVQVALGFFAADGRPLGFYDRLWKLPRGVRVSGGSYRIHKISNSKLEQKGYEAAPEMRKVLNIMRTMRERGKRIIAHNASFDCRILAQSAQHHDVKEWNIQRGDMFCTMEAAKAHCGLTSKKTGRPKAPSNSELYKHLTGSAPKGTLHDAIVDLRVSARSYVEGAKLRWW